MSFDPASRTDRLKLARAIEWWRRNLDWAYSNRATLVSDLAGESYGKKIGPRMSRQLLPLLQMTAQAYSMVLAYQSPRYRMTARSQEGKVFAKRWEAALNHRVQRLALGAMFRELALDAFLMMAVSKAYRGERPVGRTSVDDLVFDAGMGDLRQSQFIADRYRRPLDWARNNPVFDPKEAARLEPISRSERSEGERAAGDISNGADSEEGEVEPMVVLSDVWVPSCGCVGTWAIRRGFELNMERPPLAWQQWRENEYGCYRIGALFTVPDNAVPLSIAASTREQFRFVNDLLYKVAFRARNQKDLSVFPPGHEKEAQKLQRAGEFETLSLSEPDALTFKQCLGVDQPLWSLALSSTLR